MKKLLIATDNFLPRWDGIARFLAEIIPKLSKDYEITVLAPHYKGMNDVVFENAIIHRFKTFNFKIGDFPIVKPDAKRIRKYVEEADLIWTQTIGSIGHSAAKSAKKLNKPLITFIHSVDWELVKNSISGPLFFRSIIGAIVKRVVKKSYNRCSLLMAPSKNIADKIRYAGVCTPIKIVHLGIDIERFKPVYNKEEAKRKIGIDSSKVTISYVGRLGREKNLITLYRAFMQLLYKKKNIQLLIVGDGIESYKKMFSKRDEIKYFGSKNDVVPYFQATDIYVLPSLTETTSLTTMEAMACGCVVLSTKVGAIPNYLIDRYNGMFFPLQNSYVLMKKLEFMINNYSLREKIGMGARSTIKTHHTWSKTVEEIKEVLSVF